MQDSDLKSEAETLLTTTFTLQTLTPLFLAGANQQTAELRPPSFRGLMRYWQRALVGGLVGTENTGIKQVIEQEGQVFGTTESGSPVRLRLKKTPRTTAPEKLTEKLNTTVNGQYQATGKGYLIWSMAKSGNVTKGNLKEARYFYPDGTEFEISLLARPDHLAEYHKSLAAFWLMTHLGGVGSRSRRTAGSLSVIKTIAKGKSSDLLKNLPFEPASSPETLKKQLEQGIQTARTLFKDLKGQPPSLAFFDALTPATCRIWLIQGRPKPWSTMEEAMRALGESLQDYRGSFPKQDRVIFGLPLQGVTNKDRMSSPLHLCLHRLSTGQYIGVALVFKTRKEPTSRNSSPSYSPDPSDADYKRIEDWFTPTNKFSPGKVTEIQL
ncbi:MAG TPA: type III-B CRISPR module RAMP protein Cmr1 [Ktedonobacteraceae bacterium]|nr:type III-B CRISPR module RAMP protein Cmr1 [Ktedonobacteraceae bacterium]